jgi:hypothetical protein
MGRPPKGDAAMTGAERVRRWRERHGKACNETGNEKPRNETGNETTGNETGNETIAMLKERIRELEALTRAEGGLKAARLPAEQAVVSNGEANEANDANIKPGSPERLNQLFRMAMLSGNDHEALTAMRKLRVEMKRQGRDAHNVNLAQNGNGDDGGGGGGSDFSDLMKDGPRYKREQREKAAREAADEAYAEMLAKQGLAPDEKGEWCEINGKDPWLADDDPYWAESREEKRREEEESAKRRADHIKRRLAEEAKRRAEENSPEGLKKQAAAAKRRDAEAKRQAKQRLEERLKEEAARLDFDKAVALFRKRASLTPEQREVVKRIFEESHIDYMSPLRAFQQNVEEQDLAAMREIWATTQAEAPSYAPPIRRAKAS